MHTIINLFTVIKENLPNMYIHVPILLALDAGPAAGEGVGVMEEPAGEGARASGV